MFITVHERHRAVSNHTEYSRGDAVTVRPKLGGADAREATWIAGPDVFLQTPQHGPSVKGTQYDDAALVEFDDGEFGVVGLSRLE